MKANHLPIAKSVLIVATLAATVFVSAGSLTPPAGPIGSTMKDLDDVSPRGAIRNSPVFAPIVIDTSGSYYLAENIQGLPGQHGIAITASNVTLDLNGFTIRGDLEVGSVDGIHIDGTQHDISIRNGTIELFTNDGIAGGDCSRLMVKDVRAVSNGERGIRAGSSAIIEGCMAASNTSGTGISTGKDSVISHCTASNNGENGITAIGGGIAIIGCVASGNTTNGITAQGGVMTGCVASGNDVFGFVLSASLLKGSTSVDNTGGPYAIFTGTAIDNYAP